MQFARAVFCQGWLSTAAGSALAYEPAAAETVRLLLRQSLPDIPGSVFAYVLEGRVVSQLAGGAAQPYSQGQGW